MNQAVNMGTNTPYPLSELQHGISDRFLSRANIENLPGFQEIPSQERGISFGSSPYKTGFTVTRETGYPQNQNLSAQDLDAGWYAGALKQLEELDAEVAEERLPEISFNTKQQAKIIIEKLKNQRLAPIIYPTEEGEIVIQFKSPVEPSMVAIELDNDGQGACFSCINGKNRRARYQDSSELPDGFVREQLQLLNES